MRAYCPVGDLVAGMAYLVRRLLENTSNESFLREQARGAPGRGAARGAVSRAAFAQRAHLELRRAGRARGACSTRSRELDRGCRCACRS